MLLISSTNHCYFQLLRLQKKKVGGQDESDTRNGILVENFALISKVFDDANHPHRLISTAFDSVCIEKGLLWDVNGKLLGTDAGLHFDIIKRKFMQRVSLF